MNRTIESTLDEDFKDFPDLETYLKKLKEFEVLDLSKKSIKEISQLYYEYAPIFPQIWFGQKVERFNTHTFYRVRLNINPNKEDINLINTYSYPHPTSCTENGRANLKGKGVFYCSNFAPAAVLESKPKVGDEGFLSIWKPEAKREIKFAFCLPKSLRVDNEWNEVRKDLEPTMEEYLKVNGDKYGKHFVALNNFIAKKFVEEKPPYPLTSFWSDYFLYGDYWHDIILYPSITTDTRYCNYAIHPNTVDNHLKLEKVIRFVIREVGEGQFKYAIGKVGGVVNTNISWRKAKEEEKDFVNYYF